MRLHRNGLGAALMVTLALTVAGCGGSGSAAGDRLTVVTGFYPLQFVTERVGGDRVQSVSLELEVAGYRPYVTMIPLAPTGQRPVRQR